MASDTASTPTDEEAGLELSWSGRWTLGYRILALNIITVLLVALSTCSLSPASAMITQDRQLRWSAQAAPTPSRWPARPRRRCAVAVTTLW